VSLILEENEVNTVGKKVIWSGQPPWALTIQTSGVPLMFVRKAIRSPDGERAEEVALRMFK
jgi:hypothetical protein